MFVDVIPVSAVLYIINFANCYQNGPPKKLEKKLRKEEKVKKAIAIEKKKEIMQTYESGVRVTDLANMYSMSKSTISTILQRKDLYKEANVALLKVLLSQGEKGHQRAREPIVSGRLSLGVSERIIGISIISYGKNSLDLRPALGNELNS